MAIGTIVFIFFASFMAWEADRVKPKPLPIGNGDTLMVRIVGYEFCPKYCKVDHFHVGHKKKYNCEEDICEHIIYEDQHN